MINFNSQSVHDVDLGKRNLMHFESLKSNVVQESFEQKEVAVLRPYEKMLWR